MAGLDVRVQVLRAGTIDDGFATRADAFTAYGTPRWARRTDVSDAERWRAGEVGATLSTRFVVPWNSFWRGVLPTDRLQCDGTAYDIQGIKEKVRGFQLEITANARADK